MNVECGNIIIIKINFMLTQIEYFLYYWLRINNLYYSTFILHILNKVLTKLT